MLNIAAALHRDRNPEAAQATVPRCVPSLANRALPAKAGRQESRADEHAFRDGGKRASFAGMRRRAELAQGGGRHRCGSVRQSY